MFLRCNTTIDFPILVFLYLIVAPSTELGWHIVIVRFFNIGPMGKHIEAVFLARILDQTLYNLIDV